MKNFSSAQENAALLTRYSFQVYLHNVFWCAVPKFVITKNIINNYNMFYNRRQFSLQH